MKTLKAMYLTSLLILISACNAGPRSANEIPYTASTVNDYTEPLSLDEQVLIKTERIINRLVLAERILMQKLGRSSQLSTCIESLNLNTWSWECNGVAGLIKFLTSENQLTGFESEWSLPMAGTWLVQENLNIEDLTIDQLGLNGDKYTYKANWQSQRSGQTLCTLEADSLSFVVQNNEVKSLQNKEINMTCSDGLTLTLKEFFWLKTNSQYAGSVEIIATQGLVTKKDTLVIGQTGTSFGGQTKQANCKPGTTCF